MKLIYPACFYNDKETGNYTVVVPDLPGCVSGAPTLAEAISSGEDAASGWILGELEDGNSIPEASDIKNIIPEESGFVSLLTLDIDSYADKFGKKAVRKNLTIPAWLNTFAEQNKLNFSHVLTDALTTIYNNNI